MDRAVNNKGQLPFPGHKGSFPWIMGGRTTLIVGAWKRLASRHKRTAELPIYFRLNSSLKSRSRMHRGKSKGGRERGGGCNQLPVWNLSRWRH